VSNPDRPVEPGHLDADPLERAVARSRIIKALSLDLEEYASNHRLQPGEAQRFEQTYQWSELELRATTARVDQYADPGRLPERTYLLGTDPKAYPQKDLATNCVWFAKELWRLAENIDRRLDPGRAARAEQELRKLSARADKPEVVSAAGRQVMNRDGYVGELYRAGALPRTQKLMEDAAAELRKGKLQKSPQKSPQARAAAAKSPETTRGKPVADSPGSEISLAVGASIGMPAPGNALMHGKEVRHERNLLSMSTATLFQRTVADAANLPLPGDNRGRTRVRKPLPERAASVPPAQKKRSLST